MKKIDFIKDKEDYIYDEILMFPIPTLNYIRKRTGIDLLVYFNTIEEAEGKVKALTRSAKNFLFHDRLDVREWEHIITVDRNRLYKVLEFIIDFINYAFVTGDYGEVLRMSSKELSSTFSLESSRKQLLGGRLINPYIY